MLRGFARRLMAHERKVNPTSGPDAPAMFCGICDKLREPLGALTGAGGYRALLARALALAHAEVRWLHAVHIKSDGTLDFPKELARLRKEDLAKGEVILVAHLLDLLVTFIGEALMLSLLQDVWPQAPLEDWYE